MEILQLKYFCDAAELENFSNTAKKYMVPVSNISQTIKRIESELGIELFEHRSNKVILNEHGKMFYQDAKNALQTLEKAKEKITDLSNSISGDIKICCCNNRQLITNVIKHYQKYYNEVSFSISHRITDEDFDIIITDQELDASLYEKRLLFSEKILLAVNENVYSYITPETKISELSSERFISMAQNTTLYNTAKAICKQNGFIPNNTILTEDPYYAREYIGLGLGIAFVPSLSWKNLFPDKVKLLDICNYSRLVYLYYKKNQYIPKRVFLFIDTIFDNIKEYTK